MCSAAFWKLTFAINLSYSSLHNNSADGDTGGRTEAFLNCIKELEKVSEDTTMWPDKTKTLGETLRALDKEPGNL